MTPLEVVSYLLDPVYTACVLVTVACVGALEILARMGGKP